MKVILQRDNPLLRQISIPIPLAEITSKKVTDLISGMSKVLAAEPDGIALAAPQIGVLARIFVVSGKLFPDKDGKATSDRIFTNPVLTKLSRKKELIEEGCLSVRHMYGQIKRAMKASVEAYDETGKKFTHNASGLLAQVFQHEVDHLDGKLFVDQAINLQEILPEKAAEHD